MRLMYFHVSRVSVHPGAGVTGSRQVPQGGAGN